MNRKTVWVIEQGEYSDYSVRGVFSSKENAERVAVLYKRDWGDAPEVNEWVLDPAVEETLQGLVKWNVTLRRDGTVERCEQSTYYGNLNESVNLWERTKAPAYRDKPDVEDALMAEVWAKGSEHAVKIVNERRAEWIALGKWGSVPAPQEPIK